jgi:hypothetical protein
MILKKSTSIKFNEKLAERFKRLNERRRINKSWRKELRKIETSISRNLFKSSRKKLFFDEYSISRRNTEEKLLNEESIVEIHSIAVASFNTLSRQKNVEIFAVFMKNLKIQVKKQNSNTVIDFKSMILSEYHDFLNVFFKEKTNILSSHKKHNYRIKFEKDHKSNLEYTSLYNLSKYELLLVKTHLKEYLNKCFIESSTISYASLILFVKKSEQELRFCIDYRKLNAITKKNRYSISFIVETIARLFKAK